MEQSQFPNNSSLSQMCFATWASAGSEFARHQHIASDTNALTGYQGVDRVESLTEQWIRHCVHRQRLWIGGAGHVREISLNQAAVAAHRTSVKIPKYQYVGFDLSRSTRRGKRRRGDWIGGSSSG